MSGLVVDTHAAIWFVLGSARLSDVARERMLKAEAASERIFLPSICLVEMVYLVEKGRIPADCWTQLSDLLQQTDTSFAVAPLTEAIARSVAEVPRHQVPDMPDRIIAATALHLGLPLISADRRIRGADLETVW